MTEVFGDLDLTWMRDAACVGQDPAAWFPRNGAQTEKARAVCGTCPVRQECLDYAFTIRATHGIFGGLSSKRRKAKPGEERPTIECALEDCEERLPRVGAKKYCSRRHAARAATRAHEARNLAEVRDRQAAYRERNGEAIRERRRSRRQERAAELGAGS